MSKIPIFLPSPLISFSQLCPVSDNWQENKDQAFVDIHEYYTFIIIPLVTSPGFAMREASQLLSLSSFTSSVVLCNCSRLKLICCLTQFLWGSWALQQLSSSSVGLRQSVGHELLCMWTIAYPLVSQRSPWTSITQESALADCSVARD